MFRSRGRVLRVRCRAKPGLVAVSLLFCRPWEPIGLRDKNILRFLQKKAVHDRPVIHERLRVRSGDYGISDETKGYPGIYREKTDGFIKRKCKVICRKYVQGYVVDISNLYTRGQFGEKLVVFN